MVEGLSKELCAARQFGEVGCHYGGGVFGEAVCFQLQLLLEVLAVLCQFRVSLLSFDDAGPLGDGVA